MNKCKQCGCNIREGDMCQKCQREAEWLSKPEFFCTRSGCGNVIEGATAPGVCDKCKAEIEKSKIRTTCQQCKQRPALAEKTICMSCSVKNGIKRREDKKKALQNEMKPDAKECKHCKRVDKLAARGLCWKCYEKPQIRRQYETLGVPIAKKQIDIPEPAADTIHARPAPKHATTGVDESEICREVINKHGINRQLAKAAEEFAEAAAAISRFLAGEGDYNEIIGELADTEIMCVQLRMIYGNDAIDQARAEKIVRLQGRLRK